MFNIKAMDNQTPQTEDKEIQIGKYKIKVIKSLCIGAATCVAISPNIFKLDSENKAVILEGQDSPENILMAAQSCPTKAIIIIDTQTNTQIWPA